MIALIDDVDLDRDRALVVRAQSGNDEAFAQLYARYYPRLTRYAAKRLGNTADAEEIAQEAFARAYRALPTFAGERRFYPWLTVIAQRLCIDAVRRSSRCEVGEIADAATIDAGFERLELEGELKRLGEAMDRLCPRHREVLELREQHEWSYQRIADHYRVSVGTVEALIWRARRALRREYGAIAMILVGLPVIRRVQWARAADPARAMLGATALGTVAALGLVAGGSAPVAVVTPPAIVHTASTSASPIRVVIVPPPPAVVTPVASAVKVSPKQSVASVPVTSVVVPAVGRSVGPITVLPESAAQQAVDAEPLKVQLGPLSVGVDPQQMPSDLVGRIVTTTRSTSHPAKGPK